MNYDLPFDIAPARVYVMRAILQAILIIAAISTAGVLSCRMMQQEQALEIQKGPR
jgi:hypothetical protein